MKMLTGYLEPTQGQIQVDGLSMKSNMSLIQSRIGYLPENCPLWADMTIIEFLSYQAALKGIAKASIDSEVVNVIRRTNLQQKATQCIGTLSKGYHQRVGVANAILNRPKIIILDEPTNGLDPTQTLNMRTLILELAKTSTVILSTHILQEVQAICDRVIIVRAGKITTDSRMDELNQIRGLRVTVDQDEQAMNELCEDLIGIEAVELKSQYQGQYKYLLDTDIDLAAKVSQKILNAGYQLFEITPERQDLESLFKQDYTTEVDSDNESQHVA